MKPETLKCIPLVFAAWLRYLLGVDDKGGAFDISPDPNYETLKAALSGIQPGQQNVAALHRQLQPVLSTPALFGVNLYEAGLGERVEEHFTQMLAGPGAVRRLLSKMVNEYKRS